MRGWRMWAQLRAVLDMLDQWGGAPALRMNTRECQHDTGERGCREGRLLILRRVCSASRDPHGRVVLRFEFVSRRLCRTTRCSPGFAPGELGCTGARGGCFVRRFDAQPEAGMGQTCHQRGHWGGDAGMCRGIVHGARDDGCMYGAPCCRTKPATRSGPVRSLVMCAQMVERTGGFAVCSACFRRAPTACRRMIWRRVLSHVFYMHGCKLAVLLRSGDLQILRRRRFGQTVPLR